MNITKVLDDFLQSEDRVAVIKGEWGVGKTYFWNKYYDAKAKRKEINEIAYSYISLFGVDSIEDIKKKTFTSAIPLSQKLYREDLLDQKQQMLEKFFSRLGGFIRYNRLSKAFCNNLNVGIDVFGVKSSSFSLLSGYNFVNRYLICFDDLERKGRNLEVKDFMGLVDELARAKACKVVLIFNENNLKNNDQEKQFNEYREKVVDVDVMFKPALENNIRTVFNPKDPNLEFIFFAAEGLNITNIRILSKIRKILYTYEPQLTSAHREVRKDFVCRVSLLTYVYYSGVDGLTYEDFLNSSYQRAMIDDVLKSDEDKSFAAKFVSRLDSCYTRAENIFDFDISYYLNHGYMPFASQVKKGVEIKNEDYKNAELNDKLQKLWFGFYDSFKNSHQQFIDDAISIITAYNAKLTLNQMSRILVVLEHLQINCDIYVNNYLDELVSEKRLEREVTTLMGGGLESEKLSDLIKQKIVKTKKEELSLEGLISKLAGKNSYNDMDVSLLNEYSEDEYFNWIMECKSDVTEKIKYGLLKFDNHASPSPEQSEITEKAISALRRVAKTSQYNKIRVEKIFKVF